MKNKKWKAVFSDVDGTLLNDEHRITEKTLEAILTLQDKEIPFVIISARSPSGIYPILRKHRLSCPIICYSGALLLDEQQRILHQTAMSREKAGGVIRYLEQMRFDLSLNIYALDRWLVKDKNDPRVQREERIVEAYALEGSLDELPEDAGIHKLLCMCNPEKISGIEECLKKEFPGCMVVKSSDTLLEIMEQGVSKAKAMKVFCRLKGISAEDTVAFGDNYNDEEMLKMAGCGFLMGNAPELLKREIVTQTADNNHDGIYEGLCSLGMI